MKNCMKRIRYVLLYSMLLLSLLGCKTRTDLVDFGEISLITDWTRRMAELSVPASYTVKIGEQLLTFSGSSNPLPELLPGNYPLLAYNTAEGFTVSNSLASVVLQNGLLSPQPGWLFSARGSIQVQNNKTESVTLQMQQQVRLLKITLTPTGGTAGRLTGIQATLSGLAGSWDLAEEKPAGSALSVPLLFAKQANGSWQAEVRLLGIVGAKQELRGTLHFQDGNPVDLALESDLSKDLAGFNTDKHIPMSLNATMETYTEAGFSVRINDWKRETETGTAN